VPRCGTWYLRNWHPHLLRSVRRWQGLFHSLTVNARTKQVMSSQQELRTCLNTTQIPSSPFIPDKNPHPSPIPYIRFRRTPEILEFVLERSVPAPPLTLSKFLQPHLYLQHIAHILLPHSSDISNTQPKTHSRMFSL